VFNSHQITSLSCTHGRFVSINHLKILAYRGCWEIVLYEVMHFSLVASVETLGEGKHCKNSLLLRHVKLELLPLR
jgi:hypothetical protein